MGLSVSTLAERQEISIGCIQHFAGIRQIPMPGTINACIQRTSQPSRRLLLLLDVVWSFVDLCVIGYTDIFFTEFLHQKCYQIFSG